MKTNNSKLWLGIALIAGLVILISSFKKDELTKKYITLAVFRYGMKASTKITIITEDGKTQEIDGEATYGLEASMSNAITINKTINTISAKGYHLVNTVNDNATGTFYLFEKN